MAHTQSFLSHKPHACHHWQLDGEKRTATTGKLSHKLRSYFTLSPYIRFTDGQEVTSANDTYCFCWSFFFFLSKHLVTAMLVFQVAITAFASVYVFRFSACITFACWKVSSISGKIRSGMAICCRGVWVMEKQPSYKNDRLDVKQIT